MRRKYQLLIRTPGIKISLVYHTRASYAMYHQGGITILMNFEYDLVNVIHIIRGDCGLPAVLFRAIMTTKKSPG